MAISCPPSVIAGDFDIRWKEQTPAGATAEQMLQGNSDRIAILIFQVVSGGALKVSPSPRTTSNGGITLTGTPLILKFADLGPLIGLQWDCWIVGAPATLWVCEVVYKPQR